MAASVDYSYRQEDVSFAENKGKENGDDLSLFGDFNGANLNLDLLQKPNQIQVTLDSESENTLIPETKSIMQDQDSGADDLLNSENKITDYDWVLSPPSNPVSSMEMGEHATVTTNIAPKLPTLFANGVKSSTARKAPSTAKPLRSSTPTSRTAITTATKPMAPIKRSTTPTPRPSIPLTAKSASRSSTPTPRPSITAAPKSASRSSTPTSRPTTTAAAKSISRSSTPTTRPAITAAAKPASRSSTPTTRTTITAAAKSASRSSTPTQRASVTTAAKSASRSSTPTNWPSAKPGSRASTPTNRPSNPPGSLSTSRGSSTTVKSRPSKNPPEMPEKSAVILAVTEANLKAVPKRTSCSPSRRPVSNGGGINNVKSGIIKARGYPNANEDDDDVNPVLMGTKMVERVVNMRKLAPPNQNNTSGKLSLPQENSGFGRSLSKKSLDMALRHLDIRRSMPGNMRAMVTKLPASSVYSVRPESTKTQTLSTCDSPVASSNSENGQSYHQ